MKGFNASHNPNSCTTLAHIVSIAVSTSTKTSAILILASRFFLERSSFKAVGLHPNFRFVWLRSTTSNDRSSKKICQNTLRKQRFHGKQAIEEKTAERNWRKDGGSGFKSFQEVYDRTKVMVACHMTTLNNKWIKV